jgi:hypothetical protein
MGLDPQLIRAMLSDVAAWCAKLLPLDDPYHRIGDTLYEQYHNEALISSSRLATMTESPTPAMPTATTRPAIG